MDQGLHAPCKVHLRGVLEVNSRCEGSESRPKEGNGGPSPVSFRTDDIPGNIDIDMINVVSEKEVNS